ncbi:hypothetical protein D3C71_1801410 [compost metagenome]
MGCWRCTEYSSRETPTNLKVGTRILAMNTTAAIGSIPRCTSSMTPDIMVSDCPLPSELTVMIGSRLAGMYSSEAVSSNAQVRIILSGRRAWMTPPQREQNCLRLSGSSLLSLWHS